MRDTARHSYLFVTLSHIVWLCERNLLSSPPFPTQQHADCRCVAAGPAGPAGARLGPVIASWRQRRAGHPVQLLLLRADNCSARGLGAEPSVSQDARGPRLRHPARTRRWHGCRLGLPSRPRMDPGTSGRGDCGKGTSVTLGATCNVSNMLVCALEMLS